MLIECNKCISMTSTSNFGPLHSASNALAIKNYYQKPIKTKIKHQFTTFLNNLSKQLLFYFPTLTLSALTSEMATKPASGNQ